MVVILLLVENRINTEGVWRMKKNWEIICFFSLFIFRYIVCVGDSFCFPRIKTPPMTISRSTSENHNPPNPLSLDLMFKKHLLPLNPQMLYKAAFSISVLRRPGPHFSSKILGLPLPCLPPRLRDY